MREHHGVSVCLRADGWREQGKQHEAVEKGLHRKTHSGLKSCLKGVP
jgi:hypothetical protein